MPILPYKDHPCPMKRRICRLKYIHHICDDNKAFACAGLRRKSPIKNVPDVVQLCARNSKGQMFLDIAIRPDEAIELCALLNLVLMQWLGHFPAYNRIVKYKEVEDE